MVKLNITKRNVMPDVRRIAASLKPEEKRLRRIREMVAIQRSLI